MKHHPENDESHDAEKVDESVGTTAVAKKLKIGRASVYRALAA